MLKKTLYSIGYANKTIESFINTLKQYNINCIIDVRSSPYSNQYPEYNKENLKKVLNDNNILYLNFKKEFGARRLEDSTYKNITTYDNKKYEVVMFEEVWKTPDFLNGFNRVLDGLNKGFTICFMCSEKHAYDCHRGLMICEFFYKQGFNNIKHIEDFNIVFDHSYIDEKLEKSFIKERERFENMYSDILMYGGNIFTLSAKTVSKSTVDKNIEYWEGFFKNESRKNIYLLQNIKIGYKKGTDEND